MRLILSGREVEFSGEPGDPYLEHLSVYAAQLEPIMAQVASLPAGSIVFDVGANIGLSAVMTALAAPLATIYAFEPSPANLRHLRRNVAVFPNVTIVEAAVSSRAGNLRIHEAGSGSGSHIIGADHMASDTPAFPVKAITLDDFAAEYRLRPAFIKLDIEGHEPEALAGARRTLERDRPLVFMEFNTFTLNVLAGHSPAAFARALWEAYDVDVVGNPKVNAYVFMHDHLVRDGCIGDLLLRPKAGKALPGLAEMSYSSSAREAIKAASRSGGPRRVEWPAIIRRVMPTLFR